MDRCVVQFSAFNWMECCFPGSRASVISQEPETSALPCSTVFPSTDTLYAADVFMSDIRCEQLGFLADCSFQTRLASSHRETAMFNPLSPVTGIDRDAAASVP